MAKYDPLAPVPEKPAPETTVEKIKRHAISAGQKARQTAHFVGKEVDYARKEVGKFTNEPTIKGTIKYLKERGEDVGRGTKPTRAPQPQKQSKAKQPQPQHKQPKPVGKIHVGRIQAATHRPPPAYVVQNGKTLAAQLDPFGINSGVVDNYQKLTKPNPPFGHGKKPPGGGNPFGI